MASNKNYNSVLFLTPYPYDTAGSQRFRFEQYYQILEQNGILINSQGFLSHQTWNVLYKPGSFLKKTSGLIAGVLRRIMTLLTAWRYDYIFIHREATPLGPPVVEWFLTRILRKRVIYDFDDAIWLPNTTEVNSLSARLKWNQKVANICRYSYKVSCGNQFLADYAGQFNTNVIVNPTTIDTKNLHRPEQSKDGKLVIGWTGTHSTLKYLELIVPVLVELSETHDFETLVIANREPDFYVPNLSFVHWSKETEIVDLNRIDIGLMPLENDKWAEGKCGFKALQFMALEKPVVVSPAGVNSTIVEHGVSGYVCESDEDWLNKLKELCDNPNLRTKMGKQGREKVQREYSVSSNTQNFLSLFDD